MACRFQLLLAVLLYLPGATVAATGAPAGVDPRLLARLTAPSGVAVAFSRDGKQILTAGGDEANVWDAATFRRVAGPLKHGGTLRAASFTPDGRVFTAGGWEARLWDVVKGKAVVTVAADRLILSAAVSPDGKRLITGGQDGAALVWDAESGKPLFSLAHERPVTFVTFSADGRTLLTCESESRSGGDAAGISHVRDAATGEERLARGFGLSATGHSGPPVAPAALSPDGRLLAWSADWMAVVAHTTDTGDGVGRPVVALDCRSEALEWAHGWPQGAAAFCADGSRVAIPCDRGVAVIDLRGEAPSGPAAVGAAGVERVTFSPDSKKLLLACAGPNRSGVWDITPDKWTVAFHARREGEVPAAALSPDGRLVAVGYASDGYTTVARVEPLPPDDHPDTPEERELKRGVVELIGEAVQQRVLSFLRHGGQ